MELLLLYLNVGLTIDAATNIFRLITRNLFPTVWKELRFDAVVTFLWPFFVWSIIREATK